MIILANIKQLAQKYISFKEPKPAEEFILKEGPGEAGLETNNKQAIANKYSAPKQTNKDVSTNIFENLEYLKARFNVPVSGDVMFREFDITVKDSSLHAFIIFYDGMVDKQIIDDDILQPLMLLSNINITDTTPDIIAYIKAHLIPHNQISVLKDFNAIINEINYGACGIFIDSLDNAFIADVKGFERRTVERPNTELLIRGPQEGFTETLRVNTALIRKRLKDENLIVESLKVGERSKTLISVLYIKGIVNPSLVAEIKRRISSIKVDYLNDSGELEQYIEDNTYLPMPQTSSTERPDRSAIALTEGRVVIIVDGSPFALIIPVVFNDLIHAAEDYFLRYPTVNLLRFIRLMSILFSLLLPGIYIAITTFHAEMIPTSLLLAISASREKVPFPSIVELTALEIAFELIREAGIRIPGPMAPTIGIIGALILGQAAVAANIVSPILIIIVATTGICSYAIPDYSLAFSIRLARFIYILLGSFVGFLGLTTGLFIHGLFLVNAKSFGVPMFAPFGPKTSRKNADNVFNIPIWKKENRPDYLNPKDTKRQPKISREWNNRKNKGDKNE
jgi:spore germination protein KA